MLMADDKRRLPFVISGSFSIKASTLYLNSDLAEGCKNVKNTLSGYSFCLILGFFVQLSWAHLNYQEHNLLLLLLFLF